MAGIVSTLLLSLVSLPIQSHPTTASNLVDTFIDDTATISNDPPTSNNSNPNKPFLHVRLEAGRLILISSRQRHLEHFQRLFSNASNMRGYGDGTPLSMEKIEANLIDWDLKWQSGDPFSAFSMVTKSSGESWLGRKFVGTVALVKAKAFDGAELSYLLDRRYRKHGYGREAIGAVIYEYARDLLLRGYTIGSKPFTGISITPRADDKSSIRLLTSLGERCSNEVRASALHLLLVNE